MNSDALAIFSARSGNLDRLKELVSSGANINYSDPQHGTALGEAIRTNHLNVVEYLLSIGANPNIENENGQGPLEIALYYQRQAAVVALLHSGAKLTRRSRSIYKDRLEQYLKAKVKDEPSNQAL